MLNRRLSAVTRTVLSSIALAVAICAAVGAGCADGSDGSETRAACNDYVEAANACWAEAGEPNVIDNRCNEINADVDSLADVYTCRADAYIELKADGDCSTPAGASSVDISKCSYTCN